MKEIIPDLKTNSREHTPIIVDDAGVKKVGFFYTLLGVQISTVLTVQPLANRLGNNCSWSNSQDFHIIENGTDADWRLIDKDIKTAH